MSETRNSSLLGKITVLVVICCCCLSVQAKYGGGTGEPNDPYQIRDANHMQAIGADANDWDKHFKLMADIDLGQFDGKEGREEFNVIGYYIYNPHDLNPFVGVFDGNGHTILNFTYDSNDRDSIGLFGCVDDPNAEIRNLGLIDPNIDAGTGNNVGSLVGYFGYGTINECYVDGGSVSGTNLVGGLVGGNGGTITNCYATGMVTGYYTLGGLVGNNRGSIINCNSTGSVTGYYSIGGLVGKNWGNISDCYATILVTGIEDLGGLVGHNRVSIDTCYAVGVVSGTDNSRYLGGLVGGNSGIINNCHATGSVIGDQYLGGLLGINGVYGRSSSISDCYATGTVTGTDYLGGLVGLNLESISNSCATGEVTGIDFSRYIGGLVGYNAFGAPIISSSATGLISGKMYLGGLVGFNEEGIINKCNAAGAVSGGDNSYWLGGLVGYNKDSIRNCYATGAVTGGNVAWNLGGLVGMNNEGIISDCYASGLVNGNKYLGGLVGISYNGSIGNCYATGVVSGLIDVGGLLGIDEENESTLTSCYFLDPNDGSVQDNGYGEQLTDAEMKQQASFIAWDFVNVWEVCEGTNYPRLVWQIPPGDFVCPDGVNFFDYSFFAGHWAEDNCGASNDCNGRDFDLLGSVDIKDLRIFIDNWMSGF